MNAASSIDYETPKQPDSERATTVQEVDVVLLYVFSVLAFVMSTIFVAALPLCAIALWREPDAIIVFATIAALGMSVGLIGTGVGLIRRARRSKRGSDARSREKLGTGFEPVMPDQQSRTR